MTRPRSLSAIIMCHHEVLSLKGWWHSVTQPRSHSVTLYHSHAVLSLKGMVALGVSQRVVMPPLSVMVVKGAIGTRAMTAQLASSAMWPHTLCECPHSSWPAGQ